jgi:heptosyltransferase I
LQGHPAVDEILLFRRKAGLAGFVQMALQLRERPFDVVLDLQCYFKATVLTALCRAPAKIGLDPARAREFNWLVNNRHLPKRPINHVQEHFLEFLDYLQISREPVEWNLGPWPAERPWQEEFFRAIPRPRVALVAGTSNPKKDWLPERWVELNDRLHAEFGLATILVGAKSPRETALGQKMATECRHPPVNALGSGLRRLVALLDGCDLVISPDTGPLHLAGALGRPVIGLYGYNSPTRVGPWRQDPRLLIDAFHNLGETPQMTFNHRPHRMEKISVSDVLGRVKIWAASQKR